MKIIEFKIITFFSILGIAAFILSMISGILVWNHSKDRCGDVYTEYVQSFDKDQVKISKQWFDSYIECSTSHDGLREVIIHLTLSGTFIAIVFFSIIMACVYSLRTSRN